MNNTGFKVRKIREMKGFSQDYMANVLDISQASYARLENENTKITVERLQKIAEVLHTNIIDFFDTTNGITIETQSNHEGLCGLVYNLIIENKETHEKLLKAKDEQITLLQSMVDKFLK